MSYKWAKYNSPTNRYRSKKVSTNCFYSMKLQPHDAEPHDTFERIALDRLTAEQLYTWMRDTFKP